MEITRRRKIGLAAVGFLLSAIAVRPALDFYTNAAEATDAYVETHNISEDCISATRYEAEDMITAADAKTACSQVAPEVYDGLRLTVNNENSRDFIVALPLGGLVVSGVVGIAAARRQAEEY